MPASASSHDDDVSRQTLMIVEDDSGVREALCHIASSNGFLPLGFSSVSDALQSLVTARPVVLLVDWDLGEERDGVDIARVAAHCCWRPTIVMITGSSLVKLRSATRNLPVAAYLQKPFRKARVDELLQKLQTPTEDS